ncbi:hypothetical protein ACN2WE_21565 [Streptomyces sp. cg28]|uniref:hypothetical protein n=1 Tax=Streptomyces sp. cg28 TaxID=3403457 RepID=UPI003B21BE6E
MNAEPVRMPHVCFDQKPGGNLHCTRAPGHDGDHLNFYAGVTNSVGVRPGTMWPRRRDEQQPD